MRQTFLRFAVVLALVPAQSAHTEDAFFQQRRAMDPFKKGEERLRAERYEEAAAEFQKAVAIYPSFVLAHYGLGQSQMALKRYEEAVTAFSAARDAYYKMASLKMDDQLSALEASQRALDGYRNLTGIEGGSGRTANKGVAERLNVLRDLEQVKKLDDGTPQPPAEISLALAGAHFRSGNLVEAEKENKNALRANPNFGQAHNNLAVLYMMGGKVPEAQAELSLAEKSGFTINPKLKEELERRAAAAPPK
jgi:tetratricopeptide (TPR) repeat protein